VKCVLSYLRSSLLKRRNTKYRREREAKESRVNTQLAPCSPDPHYIGFITSLSGKTPFNLILTVRLLKARNYTRQAGISDACK
jgi:hypothetical protein